nr:MAG TPA: hypothetical protein [Crassvirales sp.]
MKLNASLLHAQRTFSPDDRGNNSLELWVLNLLKCLLNGVNHLFDVLFTFALSLRDEFFLHVLNHLFINHDIYTKKVLHLCLKVLDSLDTFICLCHTFFFSNTYM